MTEEQVSLNTLHRALRDFKNNMDRKFENVNQNVDRKFEDVNNRLNDLEYQIRNAQSTTTKWGIGLSVGTIIIGTGLVASYATSLGVS